MDISANQIFLTARIGDGCISKSMSAKKYHVYFSSINKDYLLYKQKIIEFAGYKTADVRTRCRNSGFNAKGIINELIVYANDKFNYYQLLQKEDIINKLDYFGFFIYYLDDGSYHVKNKSMRLHCGAFTELEANTLSDKIYELFPVKKSSVCVQTNANNKKYYYVYIPVKTTTEIIKFYSDYINNEKLLHCMKYKFGSPSQSIES